MKKLLLFVLPLLFLSCGNDEPTAVKTTHTVKFEVDGFLGRVDIDYSDGKAARQTYNYSGDSLPWAYKFTAVTGAEIFVRARIRTGLLSGGQDVSFVSADIYLNDKLWKSSPFTRGQGSTAQSSGTLP